MSKTPSRVAALVASAVLGLVALALLAAGGAAFYGESEKDSDGYLTTAHERFATDTRALATENLDVDLGDFDELADDGDLGDLRFDVRPAGDEAMFVGVARTAEIERYLHGSAHTTVADVDTDPFEVDYRDHRGTQRLAPPAGERFWAASATGTGRQTLDWEVADGDWSVVVMNADGSRGVDASVEAGASVPFLDEAGWIAGGAGVLMLVLAGGLLFAAVRRPPAQRPEEPKPLAPRSVTSS